jgi:ubiquinone/menaquinone biosynthesis C-methylase UbiE
VSNITFERYLQTLQFPKVLRELGIQNPETLTEQMRYFTEEEAERRDQMVLSYFGAEGVQRIVCSVVERLLSQPMLTENAKILDMGAGTGFFTIKIAQKLRENLPKARFYAMDITPAMLQALMRKTTDIFPFWGVAENINASIRLARKCLKIPEKFDAVYSTLTLHHCLDTDKVFRSVQEVLEPNGKAVIVGLCRHSFEEFRTEMGDIHLGFEPEKVREKASEYFGKVQMEKMPGICCECSGRKAELFLAYMVA